MAAATDTAEETLRGAVASPPEQRNVTAVYSAGEVAELFSVSEWAIYQAVRREEPPIGTLAIRVGRRVVWPKAAVNRLLCIADGEVS